MAACLRNMVKLLPVCYVSLFLCAVVLEGVLSSSRTRLQCAYHASSKQPQDAVGGHPQDRTYSDRHGSQMFPNKISRDNKTEQCGTDKQYCYTNWVTDPKNKSNVVVNSQGCWIQSDGRTCNSSKCQNILDPSKHKKNKTGFCCCSGNMCNKNYNIEFVPPSFVPTTPKSSTESPIAIDKNYKERTIIISLASVCGVAVVIILAYLTYRLCMGSQKPPPDSLEEVESPPTIDYKLDNLKLSNLISKGRYGEVWRAVLEDQEVAVKLFSQSQKQYYRNEKDIYSLPHMSHRALPIFYGAEERIDTEGQNQYLIAISYVPQGTLCSYLKHNVIDWSTLCKMTHSLASGLAHLHLDIFKEDADGIKPAVAHRDFNSRNILVKSDLSCVVCDLGFAMKIMGGRYYKNGHEEVAEQSSLTDVGTLRYMAPEVLDGAVNLRDCEASLKQIDVYALGLVLWEVASRCSDLYQGMPVPDYQLPLQAEAGIHPTFEEMQVLVSRNKTRPAFADVWKDTNPAIRALKETIEDSWDQDAEARLTALCVEERILEMASLWDGKNKGVPGITPTAHSTSTVLASLSEKVPVQRNDMSDMHEMAAHANDHGDEMVMNGEEVTVNGRTIGVQPLALRTNRGSTSDYSISTGEQSTRTMEVTLSPSEGECATLPSKSNRNQLYAKNNKVLQPHQGQNPTVARNTHKRSDEDVTIVGNTLVNNKSLPSRNVNVDTTASTSRSGMSEDPFDQLGDNLDSSLVQNDMLNHQVRHPPVPIPMVQNQVRGTNPSTRPKESNLMGSGLNVTTRPPNQPHPQHAVAAQETKTPPKSVLAKLKKGKLNIPFFNRSGSNSSAEIRNDRPDPVMEPPRYPPPSNLHVVAPKQRYAAQNIYIPSEEDLNLAQTEVNMGGESRSIRPQTLLVSEQSETYNLDEASRHLLGNSESDETMGAVVSGQIIIPAHLQMKSRSSSDISPTSPLLGQSNVELNEEQSSLSTNELINTNEYPSQSTRLSESRNNEGNSADGQKKCRNNEGSRKDNRGCKSSKAKRLAGNNGNRLNRNEIKKRSKASNEGKGDDRLSLNDDRIMSPTRAEALTKNKLIPDELPNKSSISLQQFGSCDSGIERVGPADIQC